jgi:site-specific recombinase XerD
MDDKVTLFKRSNGIYYVRQRTATGKDKWTSTGQRTKREAMSALQAGKQPRAKKTDTDVLTLANRVIEYVRGSHAARTVTVYNAALEAFMQNIGNMPVSQVTREHVDRFRLRLADSHLSPVSVNVHLRTMRAAFNLAVWWDLIAVNPFARVQQMRIPDRPPAYLTFEQFNVLCCSIGDHWIRPLVIFAMATGMRKGEILNLEWPQVDLKRQIVHVTSTDTFRTKAGRSRIVPLNKVALHSIESQPTETQYVFNYNERQVETHSLTHAFKRFVRLAGLPEAIHFHSLRHTFASWLVQDGVSLHQVGRLLGHTTTKTTEIYAHLQPETMHDVVNRLHVGDQ